MTRVLLDANALMMPVEVGVRVFDELDRLLGGSSPFDAPMPSPGRIPTDPERSSGSIGSIADLREGSSEADGDPSGLGGEDASSVKNEEGTEDVDSGIDGVTLLVPRAVCRELDGLSSGRGEEGTAASVGADLARERCYVLSHDATHADDAICELATDVDARIDCVCTNDRVLKERLFAHDVPVICLRGHNQLTIQKP